MALQELDEVRPVRRRRMWYQRRDILWATGPGRISEALAAELANNPESVNLLVTAKFPPERFHSNVYNDIGVQRGTEGTTTIVARVTPSNVRWISKQYWVTQVDLAPKK